MKASSTRLGIGWEVGVASGWGTYGLNLVRALVRRDVEPALFFANPDAVEARAKAEVHAALAAYPQWREKFRGGSFTADFPLLLAFGDKLDLPDRVRGLKGSPSIGVVFCKSAVIPRENLSAVADFPVFIAGSSWNAELLRRHGLTARNCPQGVDLDLFRPGLRHGKFGDRFVIFSGGKLEYRKGQDLVVAAFKRFHAKHEDALLVTAWHSPWPDSAADIAKSPYVTGIPPIRDGRLDVGGWLTANGLASNSWVDLGPLDHAQFPALLREVDVALATSRSEGGTNLVAMEGMATGIPTILSRNTGHLDLMGPDHCYSLDFQIPIGEITGRADLQGWGESSIDEIVAKLEDVYTHRDVADCRGAAAARFMEDWGWPAQIERLLGAIAEFV